jgi:hypothetical protein
MSTQYWETRYLAPTNTRGARIKVILSGSRRHVYTAAFDYARGGGLEQHLGAVNEALGSIGKNRLATVAFVSERGFVFLLEDTEDYDALSKQRRALAGLHARLNDMSPAEYNALVKAIWRLDREIN